MYRSFALVDFYSLPFLSKMISGVYFECFLYTGVHLKKKKL